MFRKLFLGVSAAAQVVALASFATAVRQREEKLHPTPRLPDRRRPLKVASAHRDAVRKAARRAYLKQLRKEQEIGVDPLHDHSRGRSVETLVALAMAWPAKSRKWDQENRERAV